MGAITGGGSRRDYGTDLRAARLDRTSPRGDRVLELVARVGEDGRPEGNRAERRLGRRILRLEGRRG